MTAGISLILRKAGAHRNCEKIDDSQNCQMSNVCCAMSDELVKRPTDKMTWCFDNYIKHRTTDIRHLTSCAGNFFTSPYDRRYSYSASNVLGYLDSNSTRFPVPGWRKLKYSPWSAKRRMGFARLADILSPMTRKPCPAT